MRKLKKFELRTNKFLSKEEMSKLNGGEHSFTCRTNASCNLFIGAIGITVQGTCQYYSAGTTVSCFCQNGNYYTAPRNITACWG